MLGSVTRFSFRLGTPVGTWFLWKYWLRGWKIKFCCWKIQLMKFRGLAFSGLAKFPYRRYCSACVFWSFQLCSKLYENHCWKEPWFIVHFTSLWKERRLGLGSDSPNEYRIRIRERRHVNSTWDFHKVFNFPFGFFLIFWAFIVQFVKFLSQLLLHIFSFKVAIFFLLLIC